MSLIELLKSDQPGKRVVLLGNYAIARGAIEAGVDVVTGYPGTPSSEALETLGALSRELGFYAELSVNEKVATEVAAGAAFVGMNSFVTMKHVGVNVAADFLNTLNLSGVGEGSYVIYVADDVGAWVSQNEQDTRVFANFLHIPCLSAYNPQSAKELVIEAFKISKEFSIPVILRTTERVSHASGVVTFGKLPKKEKRTFEFKKNLEQYYLGDVYAQRLHKELHEKLEKIKELSNNKNYHIINEGNSEVLLIGDGVAIMYAIEALERLGLTDKVSVLGLTIVNPLPEKLIIEFAKKAKVIGIVEEVEPYLEKEVASILHRHSISDVKIYGRFTGHLPWYSELGVDKAEEFLLDILKDTSIEVEHTRVKRLDENLPKIVEAAKRTAAPRYLSFCPGCPHLGTFYALKKALLLERVNIKKVPVNLDIGCYGLSPFSNVRLGDTSFCMGSGITLTQGMSLGVKDEKSTPVVGLIGDSTFFHAGLTGTANAIWNNHPILMIVVDNRTTAMTGHQPHPGVEYRLDGTPTKPLDITKIVKSMGYEFVEVVDPYDINSSVEAIKKAIRFIKENNKPAVIIARRACGLIVPKEEPYRIDPNKCTGCRTCIVTFGCQALQWNKDTGKAEIRAELCRGCGMCAHICPYNAIER
ncbi:MAG: 4Fe-4S binding protein [Staphylothermus sp.]|nr:4Fe-4S binding protein [Staphylothermus sp.]